MWTAKRRKRRHQSNEIYRFDVFDAILIIKIIFTIVSTENTSRRFTMRKSNFYKGTDGHPTAVLFPPVLKAGFVRVVGLRGAAVFCATLFFGSLLEW